MRPEPVGLLGFLVFAATAAAWGPAGAATPADYWNDFQRARFQEQVTTTLRIDNDSLLLNRNDGVYTSGVQLTRAFRLDAGAANSMQPVVT